MLSLWSLLKICLLLSNSVAILNKPRFLDRFDAARHEGSLTGQALNFLTAAQYMRPVLIPLNLVCIFVEMLFGS